MSGNGRAIDVGGRQDEDRGDGVRVPSSAAAQDDRNDPSLHVECANGVLQVDQLGLDLNDQKRPAIGPPPKDVDGATLAEMIERLLDADFPACVREQPHHPIL